MSKSLQERIKDIGEYNPDISYRNGSFILKINFRDGWAIIEPEDTNIIAYAKDKNKPTLHWYVSTIENVDKVFDLIEEIISVNKDMERKLLLYNEKKKELQDLFLSDISYEQLLTIQFTFKDKPKKVCTTTTPKKTRKTTKVESKSKVNKISPDKAEEKKTEEVSDIDKKVAEVIG